MTQRRAWILFLFGFGVLALCAVEVASFIPVGSWRGKARIDAVLPGVSEYETATVQRVIDGDTIQLEDGNKVRYIGVNAPESVDPRRPVQCFGKEASVFNRSMVEGKRVRLKKDVSETDKYGRLLRYVFLEDDTFVNEVLVREGYAYASAFPPDLAQKELLQRAETDARSHARGLWNPETCDGKK